MSEIRAEEWTRTSTHRLQKEGAIDVSHSLNENLFSAYGGYADKRLKKIAFGRPFRISPATNEVNQNIHCLVFVEVHEARKLRLTFAGSVPWNSDVEAQVTQLADGGAGAKPRSVEFEVSPTTIGQLRKIATAFSRITAPGRSYPISSWKYSSQETAGALRELASHLEEFLRRGGS